MIYEIQTLRYRIPSRPDDKRYAVVVDGVTVYLYWSEMTLGQRRLQLDKEARNREAYVQRFDIYGGDIA